MTSTFTLTGRILDKSKAPVARAQLVLSSNTAVVRDAAADEVYAPPPRVTTNDEGYLCIAEGRTREPADDPGVPLIIGVQYTLRGVTESLLGGRLTFTAPGSGTLDIADIIAEPPAIDPSWSDELTTINGELTTLEGELTTHAADTTNVHGIADTSVLETVTGSQNKATAAQNAATSAAATDATTKANAAQNAATSAAATDATTKVTNAVAAHLAASDPHGDRAYTTAQISAALNSLINSAPGTLDTLGEIATQLASDESAVAALTTAINAKAPIASPTFTGTVSGISKSMVGLGNVDNTTDATKPLSTNQLAAIVAREAASKLYYLKSYTTFFPDPAWVYVTGQGNTATTATLAASAGALTLTVASVTGLATDVVLILNAGTSTQQIVRIASIAGSVVTLTTALTAAVANGAAVTPLWTDDRHFTNAGWDAFAYWLANAQDSGSYVITGTAPKVTLLGNSWFANGSTRYATAINARIPGATVVNVGVAGNTSAMLLARFDTDVPSDSTYVVVNEPGVNDDIGGVSAQTELSTLEALWRKCQTIGATMIYTGHVPLQPAPAVTASRAAAFTAYIGNQSMFPFTTAAGVAGAAGLSYLEANTTTLGVGSGSLKAVSTSTTSTAFGYNSATVLTSGTGTAFGYAALAAAVTSTGNSAFGILALRFATSNNNSAFGASTLGALTTGGNNSGFGFNAGIKINSGAGNALFGYAAGAELTTQSFNTAFGGLALRNATGAINSAFGYSALTALLGGTANTGIGYNAGAALTTGNSNTIVGYGSLTTATTVSFNTVVGALALASNTGASNTAVGYNAGNAVSTGNGNTIIGYEAGHSVAGSTTDQTTTGINQTIVGRQAGGNADYITTIGYFTKATAAGGVAIGTDSTGAGATTSNADEMALGTARHTVKTAGKVSIAASTTSKAGLLVAHGAAPTSPVDGDVWTTTAGLFVRINGVTKTVTLT